MPGQIDLNTRFIEHLREDLVNNLDRVFRHTFVSYRFLHRIAEFYHLNLELG